MKKNVVLIVALYGAAFTGILESVSTPIMSRIYGDRFVDDVTPYQAIGSQGDLDDTWGTSGSLNITNGMTNPQAITIQVLSDASMFVLLKDSSNSKIVKYRSTGSIDTDFATSGVYTLAGLTDSFTSGMIVDAHGRIVVAGSNNSGNSNYPWIRRITSAGVLDGTFSWSDGANWIENIFTVVQQSSGKIVALGKNGSSQIQIARYLTTGGIDTDFGINGYVAFDGLSGSPKSQYEVKKITVGSDDSIYVGYINYDDDHGYLVKLNADGSIATEFGTDGIVVDALGTAALSTVLQDIACAVDSSGNIVIAGKVGNNILLYCYDAFTGEQAGFTSALSGSAVTLTNASDNLAFENIITTSDGNTFLVGSNITQKVMRVNSITSGGVLDTNFNGTGTLEFSIGSPSVSSIAMSGVIAPDGRLLVAGYQLNSGVTTPYISRVFNVPYVYQIPQFPLTTQQGDFDYSFGSAAVTLPGIVYPFNGSYGGSLQQKSHDIIELVSGKLLVGMDGKLDTSNNSNMSLARLTIDGLLDTTFSPTGFVVLDKHETDEYLLSVIQDDITGNIDDTTANFYVSGYSTSGAILRKYSEFGEEMWVGDIGVAGDKGLSVAIQQSLRVILFSELNGGTAGKITGHDLSDGTLDTSFGSSGVFDATGLNMGPIYAGTINPSNDTIFVAYKNSSTGEIDLAAIYADGSGLVESFGSSGIVSDIFGTTSITTNNIRLGLDRSLNIFVVAVDGVEGATDCLVAKYSEETGLLDTDFGSSGLATITSIGTNLFLQKITMVSDGSFYLTGYDNLTDDVMLVIKMTSQGALDIDFNSQAATPGILPIQLGDKTANYYARVATGLAIQSSTGNLILAGYEQEIATDATPVVLRLYGVPGTTQVKISSAGFGVGGVLDLTDLITAGAAKVIYAYRSGSQYPGKLLIGIDNSDSNTVSIARVDRRNFELDLSFGTNGVVTISSVSDLNTIVLDSNENILIAGGYVGYGSVLWAKRLTPLGEQDVSFAMPSNLDHIHGIYQQKSGRYLCCGIDGSGNGTIVAFQASATGPLAIDETFNPLGTGAVTSRYNIGTTGLYSFFINDDDTIVVAYLDTTVKIAKLKADGSGLDSSFGSSGILNTGITPTSAEDIRVVKDSNNKVVVAASISGTSVSVCRYTNAGGVDNTFNSGSGALEVSNLGSAGVTLTHLLVTNEVAGQDKIIIIGHNTAGANGKLFASRLDVNGVLDSFWNIEPTAPDTAGVLTFDANDATTMYTATIAINGNIYACATNSGGDNPIIIRIVGDNYISEQEQAPTGSPAGTLDTTLAQAENLLVDDISGLSALNGSITKFLHVFSDASYLILAQEGSSSYVARLNPIYQLDGSFNGGNLLTISNATELNGFVFDQISSSYDYEQNFYLVGTHSGAPWVKNYSNLGVENSNFTFVPFSEMTAANGIVQQSSGRLVVAGTDGSNGILSGHTITGSLDEFGVAGRTIIPNSSSIHALTIDNQDRLLVAFKNGNYVNVARVYENGGSIDTTFAVDNADRISGVVANDQIQIAVDNDGNILVAAATSTGYAVRRYLSIDGSLDTDFGTAGEVSFEFSTLTGTPVLTKLMSISNGKVAVLGYNDFAGDKRALIARLLSTGALDTEFNASGSVPGIYEFTSDSQDLILSDISLHPDRRLVALGIDSVAGNVLLTRVFGDENDYTTQVSHDLVTQVPGELDILFGTDGAFDLSNLSGVGNDQARVVRTTTGGRTLVAIDTGSVTKLVALGGPNSLDTTFDGSGISTTTSPTGVTDMFIDHNDKILMCGYTGGASWLRRYNSDGSNDTTFGTAGLVTTTITAAYTVRQQSNGRILVGGINSGSGTIIAYTSVGDLDISFGTGSGGRGIGYITIGSSGIYSFVVDSYDRIVVAYYNGSDVTLSRYHANGSGLDAAFGSSGSVYNALNATITGASQVRVGLDPDDKVVVAGATTTSVKLAGYSSSGILNTAGFGTSGYVTLSQSGVTIKDFVISQDALLAEGQVSQTDGDLIVIGYKDLADDKMFVAWFTQAGVIDTVFNPSSNVAGGPGYVSFEVDTDNSARQLVSGALLKNGKLLLAGYENTGAQDVPLLVQFYGKPYTDQVAQTPAIANPGTFDTTLNLNGKKTFTFGSGSVQQYGQAVWSTDDGFYIVGGYGTTSTDSTYNHFLITKYDSGGNVYSGFGSSGVIAAPLLSTATHEYLNDLVVDNNGRVIAVGYQASGSGNGLIRCYSSTGALDTTFGDRAGSPLTPTGRVVTQATKLYAVALQSTNRIIAVGQEDTALNKGVINAYTENGVLDPTFGLNGQWLIDDAASVHSVVVDMADNIIIVYKNSSDGTASMARIPYNGDEYDLTFGTSGKVADLFGGVISGTDTVKVTLDKDGKIVVAASMNGANTVKIRRFDSSGTVDTTFNSTGQAYTITSGNSADRTILKRLMTNEAGSYTLVGYQDIDGSTNDKFWVAQVANSGSAMDSSFNSASTSQAGENLFRISGSGSLQKLMGAAISMEGKIITVGQETVGGYSNPVMAVLYGNQYSDQIEHFTEVYNEGVFDPSFDTDGITSIYADGETASTANQQVRSVRQLTSGKLMSVIGNGVDAWTVRTNVDGSVDTSYGSGNGIMITKAAGNETVIRMELDGIGRMLVIGTNSVSGGFVKRLKADGSLDTTFNSGGVVPGAIYGVMTTPYSVVELQTGQILVSGTNSGVGTSKMYRSIGVLDTSFATAGVYTNGVSITSVAVDLTDHIFMAVGYLDTVKKVRLVAMDNTGEMSTVFGTSGVVDGAISGIDAYEHIRLTLGINPGVTVAASWNGTSGKIGVRRYDEHGEVDEYFNNGGNQYDISFNTAVVLTDMITLEYGKIMIAAYQDGGDTVTNNDYSVIARLTFAGPLDLTFNGTGKQLFQIDSSLQETRQLLSMTVQHDGRIVAGVCESPTSGESVPYLVRLYGQDYLRPLLQFPGAGTPGTADITFGRFQDGIAKVYFGRDVDLSQYAKGLSLTSLNQIILFGNGYTDSDRTYQHYLFSRLQTGGILDPNVGGAFNGAIPGTTITSLHGTDSEIVTHSLVDSFGRYIVAGYIDSTAHQALVRRYKIDGTIDNSFGGSRLGIKHPSIEEFNSIGIQSFGGKVILGGTRSGQGVVIAYSALGAVDTTFGTNGIYTFTDSTDIRALVIGASDVIYVARKVGDDLKISALQPNGSGLIPLFGTAGEVTAISNVNGTDKVWIAVDGNGKLVVAATVIDGSDSRVQVVRCTTTGVVDPTFNGGSALTLFTGDQSDRTNVVTKVITTSDNKILVVGYQDITATTADNMFVARILANGSGYDTSFNPHGATPGLYTLRVYQTGENSHFTDAQLQSDGKIVLIGNEAPSFGGNTPIVVRLHGDTQVSAVSQTPTFVSAVHPVVVGGTSGGGTAPSLGNTVSANSQGPAASSFAGSAFAGNSFGAGGFTRDVDHKDHLAAGLLRRKIGAMKNSHAFGCQPWNKNAPSWNHRG